MRHATRPDRPSPSRLPHDSLARALTGAARWLAHVLSGRSLDDVTGAGPDLGDPQLPAIRDLTYRALRAYGRDERKLSILLSRKPADPMHYALLLVAIERLQSRPDSAHTTVSQAVEAARVLGGERCAGLVNAVLRNAQRRGPELSAAVQGNDAAYWQHPSWWIERVRADHPHAWQQVLEQGNVQAGMALRVNPRRCSVAAYLEALAAAGIGARAVGVQGVLLDQPCPVSLLPGFDRGWASVQDLGAQQAALRLDVQAGMRVLDACAAPGGKTGHVLELADCDLLALDLSPARSQRVTDTLHRLDLSARVVSADCAQPHTWWDGRHFDRILADVPCSASGVVRRHPDAKWLRRADDVARFARTQRRILEALWQVLAPGGKFLYATCSVFRTENQDQVAEFVQRHDDCNRLPLDAGADIQLLPRPEHDGFYYALLQKRA